MEVTQYTYFQQVGGIECDPVAVEFTYGLERLAIAMDVGQQGEAHVWISRSLALTLMQPSCGVQCAGSSPVIAPRPCSRYIRNSQPRPKSPP
jgi:hypothetical protein